MKWDVYKHYLKSIGWTLALATILLNIIFQGFSIGSNIWLSKWSTDNRSSEEYWRNIYLGGNFFVSKINKIIFLMCYSMIFSGYGAFGIGQGEKFERKLCFFFNILIKWWVLTRVSTQFCIKFGLFLSFIHKIYWNLVKIHRSVPLWNTKKSFWILLNDWENFLSFSQTTNNTKFS